MFQRALIRASIPLVFSRGFNPHPYLSLPFPRSVGIQSLGDRLCARVCRLGGSLMQKRAGCIQQQLPKGCSILKVQVHTGRRIYYPRRVRYIFRLAQPLGQTLREHLHNCRRQIDEKDPITIQRYWAKKRKYKQVDIAPYLELLAFTEDKIELDCGVSQSGTVRVDELIRWLQIESRELAEPICRTEIKWSEN